MKFRLLLLLVLLPGLSFAQEKQKLTLEDAVIGQWTKFAPERVSNLSWLVGKPAYSFIEKDSVGPHSHITIQYLDSGRTVEYIGLNQLRRSHAKLQDLKRMPRIQWASPNSFEFRHGRVWFEYYLEDKQSFYVLELPEDAENVDFNSENNMAAFTQGDNLVIGTIEGNIKVTNDSIPGIVNGKAVHRYEFGISKGTFWSPSGRYLAYYKKDERMVTDYPLVDITTTPASLKAVKYPMAGDTSHQVSLHVIDVATQKQIQLQVEGPKDQYLTNVAWDPDEKSVFVAVLNRDQNFYQMNEYGLDSGQFVKTHFEERDSIYTQPLHAMEFLPGQTDKFLWRSEKDGFDHFYLYDRQDGFIRQVTSGPWPVDRLVGFSKGNKEVYFTAATGDGMDRSIWKAGLDSAYQEQVVMTEGMHSASINPESNGLLVNHTSLNNPYTTYLLEMDSMSMDTLVHNQDPTDSLVFGNIELFQLYLEDSTALNCRMIYPENFDSTLRYPVLLYVYNGPGVQLLTNRFRGGAPMWMNYLANEYNYLVFTIDGRGSENRGKDFEQSIFRKLGELEMDDQLFGMDYLRSLPYVDTNRFAVHGWSYGGFMTTSLMMKRPGNFTVGVAGGPVIDWKYYEVMYTERYMDRPQDNPEGYAQASLLDKVDSLKGELMLIHGSIDDVVVPQHSIDLLKKCVEAGKQIDFFLYPMHPHNVRGKDRIHLMRKVIDYVVDKNGVGPVPSEKVSDPIEEVPAPAPDQMTPPQDVAPVQDATLVAPVETPVEEAPVEVPVEEAPVEKEKEEVPVDRK
jgi:dipeptidyl-peptidase-4